MPLAPDSWEELEISVAALLAAAGLEVDHNVQIAHQQVDVLAIRRELGRNRRIAVECKFLANRLGKDGVARIYAKYHTLYATNEIDEILIVTQNGLSPRAKDMVYRQRNMSHLRFVELQSSIMDFSLYLNRLISAFDQEGLQHYYVPLAASRFETSNPTFDLLRYTMKWISAASARPLAILSSYGTGKTTFARYLAARLADQCLQDSTQRIPILIDLGRISDEQSLEGLLGRVIPLEFSVGNYSFDLFMELNRQGRFIVILDSMDEMKHGMSRGALMRNIDEIKRLISSSSRVIILGRPSIFLTESERYEALYDKYRVDNSWIRQTPFGGFDVLKLEPFSEDQIKLFLKGYLKYLEVVGASRAGIDKRVLRLLKEKKSGGFWDLASRPLQLKMLATVLPEWKKPLDRLTRTLLYSHFVNILISRESKKHARSPINVEQRRAFACALAWHMWTSPRRGFIRADDIPESVLAVVDSATVDNRALLQRELIAGCSLEFKLPDLLYFAHRTLQEFLVAEELVKRLGRCDITMEKADSLMASSPEVFDFVRGLATADHLKNARPIIFAHKSRLPATIETLYWHNDREWDSIARQVKPGVSSQWPGLFLLKQNLGCPELGWSRHSVSGGDKGPPYRLIQAGGYPYAVFGMHLLFHGHFSVLRKSSPQDTPIERIIETDCDAFIDDLHVLLKLSPTLRSDSKSLLCIREILNSVSVYIDSPKPRIELGQLRVYLLHHYQSHCCLTSFISENKLNPLCDLASVVYVTNNEALRDFKSIRDTL